MNLLLLLLIGVLIYWRVSHLDGKNVSLEFKNRLFSIRDRLRFYAIQGKLKVEDPIFIRLEQLLIKLARDSEKLNIYYLVIIYVLKNPTEEDYAELEKDFLNPVMGNKYYKETYNNIKSSLFQMLYRKHFLLIGAYKLKYMIEKNFEDLKKAIVYNVFKFQGELIPNYQFTN